MACVSPPSPAVHAVTRLEIAALPRLHLSLLGGLEAGIGDRYPVAFATRKSQALLAYLAIPPGRPHSRNSLATLLWGRIHDSQARNSLRQALFGLRKALAEVAPPALRLEGDTVAMDASSVTVDVVRFERAVAEGTPEALAAGAALYRGEFLHGLTIDESPFDDWLLIERERLHDLALGALARLIEHHRGMGALEAMVQTALRLLSLDPLQESVHRVAMRGYLQLGRRTAALRQYEHCVSVLGKELGAHPEPETRRLYETILRHPPAQVAVHEEPLDAETSRCPSVPTADTSLVGREAPMSRLRDVLREVHSGHGRLVLLTGEAGVGKSRVLRELADEHLRRGGVYLFGRSYESERDLPFSPWLTALRNESLAHALQALDRASRAEVSRGFPLSASPGRWSSDARRLFGGVAQLVERVAASQPLAIALEDFHWADEMSVRLLGFLGRRLQAWRVLLLVTASTEALSDRPLLDSTLQDLVREPHVVQTRLARLSPDDTTRLVELLGRGWQDPADLSALARDVWLASEGSPFIVVEIMQEAKGTTRESGQPLPLPERVRAMLGRRLDRLSARGQQLVSVAAVVGQHSCFTVLQRATGLTEGAAAQAAEESIRRGVLHEDDGRLAFTHQALRAVVLSRLIPPRARFLHRRVAEALESLNAAGSESARAAALAWHYGEAEVWEKAARHMRIAGAEARGRSAHREAVEWFERALSATERLPESRIRLEHALDVRLDLVRALLPLGERARIGEQLQAVEDVARRLGDHDLLARIAAFQEGSCGLGGDLDGRGMGAA
jgi:DNA-binding SARP family transcriptional activator